MILDHANLSFHSIHHHRLNVYRNDRNDHEAKAHLHRIYQTMICVDESGRLSHQSVIVGWNCSVDHPKRFECSYQTKIEKILKSNSILTRELLKVEIKFTFYICTFSLFIIFVFAPNSFPSGA